MSVSGSASMDDLGSFLERVVLPHPWRVLYEPVVVSTMELASAAARRGWPDRSLFVCDYQTTGRGREGRSWLAPGGSSLLFTVLLRDLEPWLLPTMLVALGVGDAIERLLGVEPLIKWPNDLMVNEKKLAGVLAERTTSPSGSATLVGCGVNVNQSAMQLQQVGRPATSLRLESGRLVHRGELLVVVLEQIQRMLACPPERRLAEARAGWEQRMWGLGRAVDVETPTGLVSGVISGTDRDGALLLTTADRRSLRILSGSIVLAGGAGQG